LRILRYFRFFGRLAESDDAHEKSTLEVIRNNAGGLARISGERIWSEWRKILQGPMGGQLTLRMIDLGLAQYIGLPENPKCDQLEKILGQTRPQNLHPVTLVTQLLDSRDQATNLNLRLKMSAYERDLAHFLLEHKENMPQAQDLKKWQKILLMTKLKQHNVREWIEQFILCYTPENSELLQKFKCWEIPKFPINGQDLNECGVPKGKKMGICMNQLKEVWIDSDFSLDRSNLLKVELPKIVDNIIT